MTAALAVAAAFAHARSSFDLAVLLWAKALLIAVPLGLVAGIVCIATGMMLHGLVMSVLPNRFTLHAILGAAGVFLAGVGSAALLNFSGTYDARFWLVCTSAAVGSWLYYRTVRPPRRRAATRQNVGGRPV